MSVIAIEKIRTQIQAVEGEGALITHLPDIRWATGFTGSNGILVVHPDEAHFITDGRYRTQATSEVEGATVHAPGYDLYGYCQEQGFLDGVERIVVQADHLTVSYLNNLESQFPDKSWVLAERFLSLQVAQKEPREVAAMQAAQAITEDVFTHLLGFIQVGMTEQEVASEIVYQHLRRGAERMSFEPIVAAGARGAWPHARPSGNALKKGDLVVLDFGCHLNGYASDMTRTVALGKPSKKARQVYQAVRDAQEAALDAAAAGLTSKYLDGVAREVLVKAGFGDYFTHGLGHGVGLQVHEWPSVSYRSDDVLPTAAVITIEPGVYLPEQLGVRIEDMVLLQPDGHLNLTKATKDLVSL